MPRTVGRVNHPNNEWLFTEAWGVDVNVSTPRIMSALVEEAVTVGDLVRLFTFRQGNANLVEMTLPEDSPYVGKPSGLIPWPENCALVTILRDGQVYTPDAEQPVEAGDELLFVVLAGGRGRARATCSAPAAPRAEPSPAGSRLGGGSTGVRLRASSQTIPASAASWSGQPIAILLTPSAATSGVGVDRPDLPAGRSAPARATRTQARQRPAARSGCVQSRTTCGSLVPGGRVAGDAADHEADQRPAGPGMLSDHHDGVAGVVEDAGQEVGERLVVGVAAAARPTRQAKNAADADADQALSTNCTVERCTSRTTSSTSARGRR